ncbi:MAG: hypothetical protein AAGK14_09830 [Verrucomicrobiota bacterium]
MQIIAMMLFSPRWMILAVGLVCATSMARAQDKIVFQDGKEQTGKILNVTGNSVTMQVGAGKIPFPLRNIRSVEMPPPAQLEQSIGKSAPEQISLLAPLVQRFKGLPAAWLVDAMGQLAAAYSDSGQSSKALDLYKEIQSTFPGSKFEMVATTGMAREELKKNNIPRAMSLVQPVIKASNENLMPTSTDSRIYADAYIVLGDAQAKNAMYDQALESYLAVVTIFYHNPRAVAEAEQKAQQLRANRPEAMVR